ncbi:cholesterol oxidase [Solimonas aquatica]|uniref:Cholesterol oxidase n=1 Tax=Solimonas aquatica TaxID=489703 RepID=A0A1H9JD41_9GAMM|nr:GMC oxidoreductase [Solimonas aquatica]SEQ84693.1 cholesterol oxidase [Solimonas aquatica]
MSSIKGVTRRDFLGGAAAAAAAAALPRAALARVPLTRSSERVVVIGSGFGGGVSALRLAQAGVPVLLLERGRWWATGPNAETFPHAGYPDKRVLFYGTDGLTLGPYAGLLEQCKGDNLTAMVAAGVGGGSLVYQGMTLQPTQELFNAWFPSGIDYAQMNATYYPRVAQMLQVQTAPDALINSATYAPARLFASGVLAAGYALSKIPMPIDWNYALAELRGEMNPSYTNGDCALGVNNGGKNSVDVTYIKQAVATGKVTVAALHNVTSIARASDGSWLVYADRTDETGTLLEQKIISTKALILSAGTMNSTRLLMGAARDGTISDLPDGLGKGFGTNGDQIYTWESTNKDLVVPQGGPVIYGSKEWNDPTQLANTVIQASLPPPAKDVDGSPLLQRVLGGVGGLLNTLSGHGANATTLVGYGISAGRGQFVYNTLRKKFEIQWPADGDAAIAKRINERLTAITGGEGKLYIDSTTKNTTWHPLGGACLDVVCDLEGRVKGQTGLYVLDGALMPGTTCACNPSMTIAAICERALDRIVQNDVGSII